MELQQIIDKSHRIVFFGGAGVSTESGIPDFRSVDGLYNQKYDYPPEQILSHTFFMRHTKAFYDFYRDKMLCLTAKPNKAHYKLAEMERLNIPLHTTFYCFIKLLVNHAFTSFKPFHLFRISQAYIYNSALSCIIRVRKISRLRPIKVRDG